MPVEPPVAPEWHCPQVSCQKPLEAHLVTRADLYLKANQSIDEKAKKR